MIYRQNKAGFKRRRSLLSYDLFFLGAVILILLVLILLIKQ